MWAIFKKELYCCFHSLHGYLIAAFFLLVNGIFFTVYNLIGGYVDFGYVLGSTKTILIILVPLMTMRSISEEHRQKTDQLLLSAPLRSFEIVIGKYLAVISQLLLPLLFLATCPLVLAHYADVPLLQSYSCILAYFLMSSSCFAVGILFSCLTDHPVIAAVGSFSFLLLSSLIRGISALLSSSAIQSVLLFGTLIMLIGLLAALRTKCYLLYGAASAGCALLLGVVYLINSDCFEGSFSEFLNWFALFDRYSDFSSGLLNIASLIYWLSVSAIMLILSVQALEKRR